MPTLAGSKWNTYVQVSVQSLLPVGLLVSCADGRTGIIREREIAWDHDSRRRWREHYKPGDMLEAVVLGVEHDQRLKLSLRLAQSDPWADLSDRYRLGQVIRGVVTGIRPYGVFLEIEQGVTGLLHRSRIPLWAQQRPLEELFWPGDHVRAAIELINPAHRRLKLSLMHAWPQRWSASEPVSLDQAPQLQTEEASNPPLGWSGRISLNRLWNQPAPWPILIVQSDHRQREMIAEWLRQAGQLPLAAASGEEALGLLEKERPRLALVDLALPSMSGIETIEQIRGRWPEIRCVLIAEWASATEHLETLDALCATDVQLLVKPLLPEDLLNILVEGLDPPGPPVGRAADVKPKFVADLLSAARPNRSPLGELLSSLCAATRAAQAVLFVLDPTQRKVDIVAMSGSEMLQPEALADLIYSPVRDVAEDQQIVRVEDAHLVEARIRYLKPLLNFRSCLGIPLKVDLPARYALFLFDSRANAFQMMHEEHALATALAAGALLERQRFQYHALEMQRLALLGQLSRALVHEINHHLSPIALALEDLQAQYGRSEPGLVVPAITGMEAQQANDSLTKLSRGVRRLSRVVRLFGRMTIQSQEPALDMESIVQEVIGVVRDMADRAHVAIEIRSSATFLPVRIQTMQLQQILLNIAINAIQQIGLTRPREGGRVVIDARREQQREQALLISVEDDGPGVHRRLWERVFEPGFTTRHDGGSGLGLYITRGLAEMSGGSVYIAESTLLWGTTFVVELPIAL